MTKKQRKMRNKNLIFDYKRRIYSLKELMYKYNISKQTIYNVISEERGNEHKKNDTQFM